MTKTVVKSNPAGVIIAVLVTVATGISLWPVLRTFVNTFATLGGVL